MQTFDSDGVDIAYLDEGSGEPILLIHGFASNKETNWVWPGWVKTLRDAGRRVIALDNRGHGASQKLYDPEAYPAAMMAEDARRLIEHLGFQRADVMGYSMGARITAFLTLNHPGLVRRAVFGGLGINMVRGVGNSEPIARALETDDIGHVSDPIGRAFREFAEQTKSDLKALAACIRSSRERITPERLATMTAPALVAVGSKDVVGGSAAELAKLIPTGTAYEIPNRDHMLAVGDKNFKAAVVAFLNEAD